MSCKMLKYKILLVVAMAALAAGCSLFDVDKEPYSSALHTLVVSPVFPEGYEEFKGEGLEVKVGDIDKGQTYSVRTGSDGNASIKLPNGNYRLILSAKTQDWLFNGSADKVILNGKDKSMSVEMVASKKGDLIIKEIYCGGCQAYPLQGRYQVDSYLIIHNNSATVQYLDNLCLGTLDPYNAEGTNVWVKKDPVTGASIFGDFVPVIQAVWKIRGDGKQFPLNPGEDAVISIFGAIDHTVTYPQSVNLNKKGYFVCYDNVLFPNSKYHPAPGTEIDEAHHLAVVIKTGQAKAYTFSLNSPAIVIFRAEGQTIEDFVKSETNVVQKPGTTVDRVVKVPNNWVMDGVEVFTGKSSGNVKRLGPAVDAGFVPFSAPFLRHTLHRKVDQEATAQMGYEVLMDSNNSSVDFYERQTQSLSDK